MKNLMSLITTTFLTAFLMLSGLGSVQAQTAPTPQLKLSSSATTVDFNQEVTLQVKIDTTTNATALNAGTVKAIIRYNAAHFDYVRSEDTTSDFKNLLAFSNVDGVITTSRGATASNISGTNKSVVNLVFKAKTNYVGLSQFEGQTGSKVWASGTGTEYALGLGGARATVSILPFAPVINSFGPEPATATSVTGESPLTLKWDVSNVSVANGDTIKLSGQGLTGEVDVTTAAAAPTAINTQYTFSPTITEAEAQNKTYTLKVTNAKGVVTRTTVIQIKPKAPKVEFFRALNSTVAPGTPATLTWNIDATSGPLSDLTISGPGLTGSPSFLNDADKSIQVVPDVTLGNATYTLTAKNMTSAATPQTDIKTVTIDVSADRPTITSFTVTPSTVKETDTNKTVTLSWTSNAISVTISPLPGSFNGTGSTTYAVSQDTTFRLRAFAIDSTKFTDSVQTVSYLPKPALTQTLTSSTIFLGKDITTSWTINPSTFNLSSPDHRLTLNIRRGTDLIYTSNIKTSTSLGNSSMLVGNTAHMPKQPGTYTVEIVAVGLGGQTSTDTKQVIVNDSRLQFCVTEPTATTARPVSGARVYPTSGILHAPVTYRAWYGTDLPVQDSYDHLITGTDGCTNTTFIRYTNPPLAPGVDYTAYATKDKYITTDTKTFTRANGIQVVTLNMTAVKAIVSDFTASPATLNESGNVTFNWTVNNSLIDSYTLTSSVPGSSSVTIPGTATSHILNAVTQSATYTLIANGPGGASDSVTTSVTINQKPNVTFSAARTSIHEGESTKLTWSITNWDKALAGHTLMLTGGGLNQDVKNTTPAELTISPAQDTVYTLTAVGYGGLQRVSTVEVKIVASSLVFCVKSSVNNSAIAGVTIMPALPSILKPGFETLVTNQQGCTLPEQVDYTKALPGTYFANVSAPNYVTRIESWTRSAGVQTVNIVLAPSSAVITSFTSDKNVIDKGQSATLAWVTEGSLTSITLLPDNTNVTGLNQHVVSPTSTTNYFLVINGPGGGETKGPVTITVNPVSLKFCVQTTSNTGQTTNITGAHLTPGLDLIGTNPDSTSYLVTGTDGCTNPTFIDEAKLIAMATGTQATATIEAAGFQTKTISWTRSGGTQVVTLNMNVVPELILSNIQGIQESDGQNKVGFQMNGTVSIKNLATDTMVVTDIPWTGTVQSADRNLHVALTNQQLVDSVNALPANYRLSFLIKPEYSLALKHDSEVTNLSQPIYVSKTVRRGDITGDNQIRLIDLTGLLPCYNETNSKFNNESCSTNKYDIAEDDQVTIRDLTTMLFNYEQTGDTL